MAQAAWPLVQRKFGETTRRDAWWIQPLVVFLGLSAFIVYATWAAFQGDHFGTVLPVAVLFAGALRRLSARLVRAEAGMVAGVAALLAALLILWAPGGFRFTCYYYRGAYYKAFWADPPSCTVGEPRKSYLGEQLVSARSFRTSTATSCISR